METHFANVADNEVNLEDSKRSLLDMLTAHVRSWLLGVSLLMLLGLYLLLGPKFPPGPIHIHIARGHGIITSDLFAIIPIILSVLWFFAGIWRHRESWMGSIRRSPVKAFFFALALGIFLGLLFGIPWGAIYRYEVRDFMHFITQPFR